MRYSTEHKEGTRRKILDAAARRFRAEGYDGLGVDGLAKAAGVTNGAFYGHFPSKADAFREVVTTGLDDLRQGIEQFRAEGGADWISKFAQFYFSDEKIGLAENACALPAFAPEVVRAPEETREAFPAKLLEVLGAMEAGLAPNASGDAADRTWVLLALLVGGVTLARAVPDQAMSHHIAEVLRRAVRDQGASSV